MAIVTFPQRARTLVRFVSQVAPIFWRRMAEDRRRLVQPAPFVPDTVAWPAEGIHAAWIGHSTVLIRVDGFTILTDPVFSTRAGIKIGPVTLGIKRLVHPALRLPELPVPDLIGDSAEGEH